MTRTPLGTVNTVRDSLSTVVAFSWLPMLVVPSPLIVDTILLHLTLVLLSLAYLAIAAWGRIRTHGGLAVRRARLP